MPDTPKRQGATAKLQEDVTEIKSELGQVKDMIDMLKPALAGLAGLDNIAAGVADIAEVLAPLSDVGGRPRLPRPAVTAAIGRIRGAVEVIPPEHLDVTAIPAAAIEFIGAASLTDDTGTNGDYPDRTLTKGSSR
jgi:hypothetical protein